VRKRAVRAFYALLGLILAGCAADTQWTKPGAVRGQVEVDMFICRQWSTWGMTFYPQGFHDCMVLMGWRPTGESGLPPE
jgi:hypothetical protein